METAVNSKVALVVGATDEVGEAIARQLASAGVQLALAAADGGKLEAFARQIPDANILTLQVDATDAAAVADCVKQVLTRFGKIDILVNNAGEVAGKPLSALTAGDVAAAFNRVVAAPFHFIREVVPRMQRDGYGRVVNVSELDYLGLANQSNAAAARSALFGLTRSVALESARQGVTVNTVVKGDIANSGTPEAEKDKLANAIPVKRVGTAADVARAVCFFAADSGKYLNGQTLFVCGGKSAYFSMSV